jgi:hypothetical protein
MISEERRNNLQCLKIHSSVRSSPANTLPPGSWPRSISAAPKDRFQTEVESWRNLQSANIEFSETPIRF